VHFEIADLLTIGLLVLLEGLLSADNALVLAILVLGLPPAEQRKALRYGILGAFAFRILAIFFASLMIRLAWVKLVGGAYLLNLAYNHFFSGGEAEARHRAKPAAPWLGLSAFWATVVKVELTDIVFAVDSILVAVAMSPKLWVIITGGILGIIAMRVVIGQLLAIVQRYPALVDGAFVIIAWVGIKLLAEFLHQIGYLHFEIPKWFSLGLIAVIFAIAYLYARRIGPASVQEEETDAARLLVEEAGEAK
jgi:YkoY family integral membrane protein